MNSPAPLAANPNDARVLLVGAGELFGGVERHLLDLLGALADRGAPARLAVFHDAELAERARQRGFGVQVLPAARSATPKAAAALAASLERQRIDVVHVHGYKAMFVCALAQRRRPVGVLATQHGLPEGTSGPRRQALRNRAYAALAALAARSAGATICYVTRELQAHFATAHSGLQSHVVPNGIAALEPDQFPRPAGLDPGCFNLALVGRLEPVKGQSVAIEAIATLPDELPIRLHLLGDGPCANALRDLVARHGLGERVGLLGFRRDAHAFIAHCDALLMPSVHEGLPYTLLEAMSLGTPVIATRVGGLAEILRNDETALLVPPRDRQALAAGIMRLFGDAALAARIAKRARLLQQRDYSVERMAAEYLGLYRQLAVSSRTAPIAAKASATTIE